MGADMPVHRRGDSRRAVPAGQRPQGVQADGAERHVDALAEDVCGVRCGVGACCWGGGVVFEEGEVEVRDVEGCGGVGKAGVVYMCGRGGAGPLLSGWPLLDTASGCLY